jgi:hypothetical protein
MNEVIFYEPIKVPHSRKRLYKFGIYYYDSSESLDCEDFREFIERVTAKRNKYIIVKRKVKNVRPEKRKTT